MKKIAILIGLLIVTLITLFIVVQLNQNPEVTKTPENTKQENNTLCKLHCFASGVLSIKRTLILG